MYSSHYIFSAGDLYRKDNTLYFKSIDNEHPNILPIEQITDLHAFGQINLNNQVLILLGKYGVKLHIYNYYGFYSGSFYPREQSFSGFNTIEQCKCYIDYDKRVELAKMFLYAGIHHMKRNLNKFKEKKSFTDDISKIIEYEEKLKVAKTINEIMGYEGNIRKVYYNTFNTLLPEPFKFEERSKRPPKDQLNVLISFGNSLLYTAILSEMYKTPIDTTISFLHEPSDKRFSLGLDISEIFKPLIIDPIITSLIRTKVIKENDFEFIDGFCLLKDDAKKKFIQSFEEKMQTTIMHRHLKRNVSYRGLIRLECYKLIKHFIGEQPYKSLKAWW